jgi:hypothetical protein
MNNRQITFPPTIPVAVQNRDEPTGTGSVDFGLAEYLLDNALVRPEAFTSDNVSLTALVVSQIGPWRGKAQEGKRLTISQGQFEALSKLCYPAGNTAPQFTLAVAKALQALYSASEVPSDPNP